MVSFLPSIPLSTPSVMPYLALLHLSCWDRLSSEIHGTYTHLLANKPWDTGSRPGFRLSSKRGDFWWCCFSSWSFCLRGTWNLVSAWSSSWSLVSQCRDPRCLATLRGNTLPLSHSTLLSLPSQLGQVGPLSHFNFILHFFPSMHNQFWLHIHHFNRLGFTGILELCSAQYCTE